MSVAEEGIRGLGKGWAPTLLGYSMQGVGKFGFYEVFKIFYSGLLGEVSAGVKWVFELHEEMLVVMMSVTVRPSVRPAMGQT